MTTQVDLLSDALARPIPAVRRSASLALPYVLAA